MATHHASPSEIVDLETWAQDLPCEHGKTIVKTKEKRLAFQAGLTRAFQSSRFPVKS